jgi:hypothetical protein
LIEDPAVRSALSVYLVFGTLVVLGVEHEPAGRRRGAAHRLAHAGLDVAGVGEERPVVEAVDDDSRSDACRAVQCDVGVATEPRDPHEHGVCGWALRRTRTAATPWM